MKKIGALALVLLLLGGCARPSSSSIQPEPPQTAAPVLFVQTRPQATEPPPVETTAAPTPETAETSPPASFGGQAQSGAQSYVLSFAGDCTLAREQDEYSASSFTSVVGTQYAYPFEYAAAFFKSDDFSIINLECALTESDAAEEKTFRFKGPPEYAKILTEGGVEFANLANNHSGDYGEQGLADTVAALEAEGRGWVKDGGTALYTTDSGLVIGLYAAFYDYSIADGVEALRAAGAELVIVSLHFGEEGSYQITEAQRYWAHYAIDSGADIVFGHHPHVLQPIEQYGDGVIYYSLGNFSFGGNGNPRDKDTAIIQQTVTRAEDGSISLGQTRAIPFSLSGYESYNDYRPVPYAPGDERYARTLSKLDGTFDGPDLSVTYNNDEEENETEEEDTQEENTEE